MGRKATPGLPRPDAVVGPVTPASRNSSAAAAAAAVAAAVAAGYKTEGDFIHDLEVNPGKYATTDAETSTDEGYAKDAGRSAAEETGTDGEASTHGQGNA